MTVAVGAAFPAGAAGEQASQPGSPAAGQLDAGRDHSCVLLAGGSVRCWGYGGDGELGYGNTQTIGDDEAPGVVGPVDLGPGRTATAIAAGAFHTCAVLDNGEVRCWGFGAEGRLGYGSTSNVGDDETPGSVNAVNLGAGRTAKAITAGYAHTCAILDDGTVRCWGYGRDGELGYADRRDIGDDESPASVGPVDLGVGRTAKAISAGYVHTCALLDNGAVRCWGYGLEGRLGYGNTSTIGDDETPGSVDPVDVGAGRTATAVSAGTLHTCALLDNGTVRCWGEGGEGALGYANTETVGDDEVPGSVRPVDLGVGRTAKAITTGRHSCARLDDGTVRCWGANSVGQLGYGNTSAIGDNEPPGSIGPVDLGPGHTALAISAGEFHTCALLDDTNVRCWGLGTNGRLGSCNDNTIGDDETPGSVGPLILSPPTSEGAGCFGPTDRPPTSPALSPAADLQAAGLKGQAARLRGLRKCLTKVRSHARRKRHMRRQPYRMRRRCLARWGRTPGRVSVLKARALSNTKVVLTFKAPGSDGNRPPAAQGYLVKQGRRAIRGARDFRLAQTLCKGTCRFPTVTVVGANITLTVADLLPHTTYYYVVAARDNVSRRLGPRSRAARARTR